jgi:hypothetical protein
MPKAQFSSSTTDAGTFSVSDKQRQGRAVNAVAELLMRKLLVPKIFLEPKKGLKLFLKPHVLPIGNALIDVLAIDRAGSGDVHAVDVPTFKEMQLEQFLLNLAKTILEHQPVHFYYIAVDSAFVSVASNLRLFPEDGIGRIGIIEILERSIAPPEARIVIPAERFRVKQDWLKLFDQFQKKTPADMEIRG